jgi:hypothetical protein
MIPYDIDPSLHSAEPEDFLLQDGFSRRSHGESCGPATIDAPPNLEDALADKSDF